MEELLSHIPDWAGTVPQWFLFATVLIAAMKLIPVLRQQSMDKETSDVNGLRTELREMRAALKECQDECEAATKEAQKEIRGLHEEMWAMRKQNIAEQISLINIILQSVDAPELRSLLSVLENVGGRLAVAAATHKERDDAKGS